MYKKRGKDVNMRFLFGSVFFFFILLMTIVLFSYFTLEQYWDKPQDTSLRYEFVFSPDFSGKNYDLYLNDSLLYEGAPVSVDTVISVNRFAVDNALLLVERESDIVSILVIKEKEGRGVISLGADGAILNMAK